MKRYIGIIGSFIIAVLKVGISSGDIVTQIIGGDDTTIEMYPWQAMLQKRSSIKDSWGLACGAVFISEKWLITAAHCFRGRVGNRRIVYGFTRQSDPDKQIGEIKRFIKHPKFNRKFNPKTDVFLGENDIVLVELKAPVLFTKTSQLVALSSSKINIYLDTCNITGWGLTKSGDTADTLQVATVSVLSIEACRRKFENIISIANSQICLFDEINFKTSCQGDSGSPLTCMMNGTIPVLCGISSFGETGCSGTLPVVYTRVSSYLEWIQSITGVKAIE